MTRPAAVAREWDAHYLDGRTAARQRARVHLQPTGLEIVTEDGARLWWPYGEIRQTQGTYAGELVRLEHGGELAEALLIPDVGVLTALHRIAPRAARHFHDPARRRRRIPLVLAAGVAAIATAAVLYLWVIPFAASVVAARVPVSWEEQLGRSVVEQFAPVRERCTGAEGIRQLEAIVTRLTSAVPGSPYTFRVFAVDRKPVNAFAAPGGYVVVYRGLIERANSPEEMAGVLAHEVQHVLRRHVTRALFQHASAGILLAAVTGDATGTAAYAVEAARTLGTLRYSRQNEEEADVEGLRLLRSAGIDPRGMIAFFESLRQTELKLPGALAYVSTHPATEARIAGLRALAAAAPAAPPTPLLSPEGWAALKAACPAKP